jgi:hypothetical protein
MQKYKKHLYSRFKLEHTVVKLTDNRIKDKKRGELLNLFETIDSKRH